MRALVFLLILANLLFFAYAQGYLGTPVSPDALRLQQQINPDRLRILADGGEGGAREAAPVPADPAPAASGSEAAAGPAAEAASPAQAADQVPASPPAPAPAAASGKKPAPDTEAAPAAAGQALACLLLTGLSEGDAQRLADKAGQDGLMASRRSEGGWWVFLPPQPDKKGAEKKAGELQRLGVTEFFIVTDGPQKFAISLGVFSREEAARKHLEQLRGKGVRSARMGTRSIEGARQLLEVRGGDGELAAFRKALPAGSTPRDCP